MADRGATWWQGSYDLPWPPTKVSTKLAHRQLSNWPVKMTHRQSNTLHYSFSRLRRQLSTKAIFTKYCRSSSIPYALIHGEREGEGVKERSLVLLRGNNLMSHGNNTNSWTNEWMVLQPKKHDPGWLDALMLSQPLVSPPQYFISFQLGLRV